MGASELRSDLIKILGSIENEEFIRAIYDMVKEHEQGQEGKFWATLTEEQKKEIYLSYEESDQDVNLKKWDEIKNKY